MKLFKSILCVTMLIFLGVMFIINIITPDKAFSEAENRILSSKPSFSWNGLKEGKFTKEYEQYIIDQFAYRDFWVGVKANAERLLQKKDNNGVYLGKDGYLLQKIDSLDKELLQKNISSINTFAEKNPGIKVNFLLVPNSVKILEEKLPAYAVSVNQLDIIKDTKKQLKPQINFVDIYDELRNHNDEYIYYKTDHHWTTLGAYYAYRELGKSMGYVPLSLEDFAIEKVTDEFYGTLYSKSNYRFIKSDSISIFKPKNQYKVKVEHLDNGNISDSLYELSYLNKKDKYSVFLDGNHALSVIKTDNSKNKKLLVLKDSFAHSLVPFLSNNYGEIHMMDLRYFNMSLSEYVKQNNIEEVLLVYNAASFIEDSSVIKMKI
jgi:hypothetical protein